MKQIKRASNLIWKIGIYSLIGGFLLVAGLRVSMLLIGRSKMYTPENVPTAPVALVLGAGLNRDGSPGVVLQDRVRQAAALYFDGKVQKLLMSGDNSSIHYDEPTAMRNYAISLGVPDKDIVLDYAGRRTYDSCYRASVIFGVEKVIVVTQNYHLHRAIVLCQAMEIETFGVAADESNYPRSRYIMWRFREVLASIAAFYDIWIRHPQPILGEPEPIFE